MNGISQMRARPSTSSELTIRDYSEVESLPPSERAVSVIVVEVPKIFSPSKREGGVCDSG